MRNLAAPPGESQWIICYFAECVSAFAPCIMWKTWRHPQNWKYTMHCIAVRGEPSHATANLCNLCRRFRDVCTLWFVDSERTDRQTDTLIAILPVTPGRSNKTEGEYNNSVLLVPEPLCGNICRPCVSPFWLHVASVIGLIQLLLLLRQLMMMYILILKRDYVHKGNDCPGGYHHH